LEIEIPNNEIVDYCYFYRMKYLSPVVFRDLDYDPGGMMMVGRSWEVGSGYRYGFNGKECDDEVSGKGNLNIVEFWGYDTRLGRRWNLDPIFNYSESLYACFRNNPILIVDPDGDSPFIFLFPLIKAMAVGFVIGATTDYGVQVTGNYLDGTEEPWKNVDRRSIIISGGFGSVSFGLGNTIKTTSSLVIVIDKIVLPAGESVANQMNENSHDGDESTDIFDISYIKIGSDVLADFIPSKVLPKTIDMEDIHFKQKAADREKRIYNNNPTNGNKVSMENAQKNLNSKINVSQNTKEFIGQSYTEMFQNININSSQGSLNQGNKYTHEIKMDETQIETIDITKTLDLNKLGNK